MMCVTLSGLTDANDKYSEKHGGGNYSQKSMINLAWKVRELSELNDNGRKITRQIYSVLRIPQLTW